MRFLKDIAAIGVLAGLGLLFNLAHAAAAGDSQKGREIAIDHCARCHVIADYNPYGGIGNTPSFRIMAARDDYLERFETFFSRPPHPVFVRVSGVPRLSESPAAAAEFEVLPEQIADIVAFVEVLRAAQ